MGARLHAQVSDGAGRRSGPGLHFSSIRAYRQIDRAITQVTTNMPTITKPRKLMSMFSNQFQNEPDRFSSEPTNPPSSIVPITTATATDRPVIVML